MLKLLLPVDGSDCADRAVQYVIGLTRSGLDLKLHLINVQTAMTGDVAAFVPAHTIAEFQRENGEKATLSARTALADAQVNCEVHYGLGISAEIIAEFVRDHDIDQIVMGSRGLGALGNLVLGSVATKVIHLVDVPVTLVK